VREAGVELQRRFLEQLDLEQGGAFVRNDLVVVPLHHERRHVDAFQILGKVCLRERLDAVVMGLGPAHHALTPPILDDALERLRARPIEPVERGGGDIAIKLGAIVSQAFAKSIEHLDRKTVRVIRRLHHDRRHS